MTLSAPHKVPQHPHRKTLHPLQGLADSESRTGFSSSPRAQQLFPLAPCSTLSELGTERGHVAYSLPVGSGLIGSKEVEGLGRTELLSSEAEDCSGCVSSPAVWLLDVGTVLRGSRSPLLLGSATETLPSAKSRTHENVICDQPPNKLLRHRANPHLQC